MTTKGYLLQIIIQTNRIKKQEEYIQRLKDSLDVTGITYDKEKVQSSPDFNKFAKVFGQIDEEEQKLELMKERLVDVRVVIVNQIQQLDDDKERDVLYRLYVDGLNLSEVASEMCLSYGYVKGIHANALCSFSERFQSEVR